MAFENQKPPYRMICEQTASKQTKIYLGSEFQHANKNETASVYLNTTKVPDPQGGSDIAPYERWTFDETGGLTCQVHHCTGSAPCSAWERPFIENTFTASHDASGSQVTESFVTCHKTGFKTVQARKAWQGSWGFNNLEASNAPDFVSGCGTWPDSASISYRSYHSASKRTKYRTIAMSSDWTYTDLVNSDNNDFDSIAVTETINSGSGLYSFSGFSTTTGKGLSHSNTKIGLPLAGMSSVIGAMCSPQTSLYSGSSATWGSSGYTIHDDPHDYDVEVGVYDISAGTFSRDLYIGYGNLADPSSGDFGVVKIWHEEYSISETGFSYSSQRKGWNTSIFPATQLTEEDYSVSATLSDAYTDADVYNEVKGMLNEWDLTNDTQYPWRQDSKPQIAPLVSRDEQVLNNFTTNFTVANFGDPISDFGFFNYPDYDWSGNCGLTLVQDPSTGTTTIAIDFGSTPSGTPIDGTITNPFGYILSSSTLTYSVIGGAFPDGVTFNSSTGEYSGTVSTDGHWGVTIQISCGIPSLTGELLGPPLPAGHHDYFNFRYNDLKACCDRDDVGDVTWDIYQQGWGQNVSTFNSFAGTQLPLNTTNWNNSIESMNKPDGAWLFYADPLNSYFPAGCVSSFGTAGGFDNSFLVGQKYAIIFDDWPSQNFARPAGADKFMYNEIIGNVYMITGSVIGTGSGQTVELCDLINHNTVPDGTDFSGIWGGPAVDGFYNVTYGSGHATLGTKLYDVPSDWKSASGDESLCFGRLRYPGVCSVLGRQLVTSLTDSGSGTILTWAVPQTNFGLDISAGHHETVSIYDTQMNLITGSISVKRVDDTQFSCSVSSSILKNGASYYVTVSGSAPWYMNDSSPKGDYVLLEWLADYRSSGEFGRITGSVDCSGNQVTLPTHNAGGGDINNLFAMFSQSQACLPVSPCSPKVICISPNGEQFPNGHTYPFPSEFIMDETYGAKWYKLPLTVMTDLLWEQPHRKAGIETCAPWKNDNYGCNTDVITPCPGDPDYTGEEPPPEYFFAAPPQVEARLTVPCNYGMNQNECGPAVPSDVQIGFLSPVIYPFGSASGSVAIPPAEARTSQTGEPNSVQLPSAIHASICGAESGGCRFPYSTAGCGV